MYATKSLILGNAAGVSCRGQAAGWAGRVTGARIPPTHAKLEASIVAAVNGFRIAHGLRPLKTSATLGYAARYHSSDMHRKHYFEHERVGETFTLRFSRYTPSVCVAENIAWGTGGFATASGVVSLWRSSPGHRHVMLLPWVRRIGVGVIGGTFFGQRHARIVTADFSG